MVSEFPFRQITANDQPINVDEPWDYPGELAGDVTTKSGATLHLRPIRPSDNGRLVNFHRGLSTSSVYRRYFSFHPELSSAEVERFTQVDYLHRFALVALERDQIVAVGRYDRVSGTSEAEVAFIVADHYQHQGIGLLLLQHLADAATTRAITTFTAETQSDNRCMMNVFEDSGFRCSATLAHDIVSVRCDIRRGDIRRELSIERHLGDDGTGSGAPRC